MTYLAGLLSGALSGVAIAWVGAKAMKSDESRILMSLLENKIFLVAGSIFWVFLFCPMVTYDYSLKYTREGYNALWEHALTTLLFNLPILILLIWQNRLYWKPYLIFFVTIFFAIGFLIPLLFNLIAG